MNAHHLVGLERWLPDDAIKVLLVLFLAFLVGLEREEHHATSENYAFGGVRTVPLIGLLGFSVALLSGGQIAAVVVGLAVVGAFLLVSYLHKLSTAPTAGVTSEMSGLMVFVVGALVWRGQYWLATSLAVASVMLLELKAALEGISRRIAPEELFSFTKFLLLSAVILPMVPNRDIGVLQINPFKTWLVVVAVSTVSYASYLLQKVTKDKGGVLLSAVLGGAYSSTVTTVVLAKRASREERPHLFAGCTLIASGMMYLRLAALISVFNRHLMLRLGLPFVLLAVLTVLVGWIWSRLPDAATHDVKREYSAGNPLELRAAFTFALIFLAALVATHLTVEYLGHAGVYALAAVMGVTDVDPFIMGLTQSAGAATPLSLAAAGIVIAAASNNLIKGIYAFSLSDRRTGVQSLSLLGGLAVVGLALLVVAGR